jgi:hypothetical protein
MIQAMLKNKDDEDICDPIWLRAVPRVGEYVWISGDDRERVKADNGTASFMVIEVAHWCGPTWQPVSHDGEPNHTVCLYVKPVK